eukprot:gene15014-17756_t
MGDEESPLIGDYEKPKSFRDGNLYNIILLGAAFCLVFSAFSPTQNLETSLHGNLGFTSLSVLYAVLAVSNFISPLIVIKMGEKYALILGTLTYTAFIAANIKGTAVTLYIGSAIIGFGAAVLWTAEGAFVIRCSTEKTLGFHTGLFFAIFQLNQITGNIPVGAMIKDNVADSLIFIILTVVCGSSIILFLFLGKPNNLTEEERREKDKYVGLGERLMLTVGILKEIPILMLIVALLYSGISQSFFFGTFPSVVGKENLNYVMAAFGAFDAIGSVVIGKLSDIIGRKPLIIFATMCTIGGTVFVYIIDTHITENKLILFYVCSGIMGFADAGYNTLVYSLLGSLYPTRGESAAAVFKFVQALASAAAFFYSQPSVKITLLDNVIITNSFVVPSCIMFILVEMIYCKKQQEVVVYK